MCGAPSASLSDLANAFELGFVAVTPRVLILTASVGEGHDLPARTLAEQLRAERPGVEIETEDCLVAMGPVIALVAEGAPSVIFHRLQWLWDVGFWLVASTALSRRLAQLALTRVGGRGLLRLIEARRPNVIVSVYPAVTEVLGRLRRRGRIGVPVVAAITDIAALHYWATPGADFHLVTHPEAVEEVRKIAGADATVHCVHGLTAPEFRFRRAGADARQALGLEQNGTIVVVSGGGWGVGDLEGAVEEALDLERVSEVVCLCGRNTKLRQRLARRFEAESRVRVEGFTKQMPDWLAAADALVHSTGGLTMLEAQMRGCPAISYGWGRGHLRLHDQAFRRFGLAEVAETRAELRTALAVALERGRRSIDGFADLPSAASFVLAAAEAARSSHAG